MQRIFQTIKCLHISLLKELKSIRILRDYKHYTLTGLGNVPQFKKLVTLDLLSAPRTGRYVFHPGALLQT